MKPSDVPVPVQLKDLSEIGAAAVGAGMGALMGSISFYHLAVRQMSECVDNPGFDSGSPAGMMLVLVGFTIYKFLLVPLGGLIGGVLGACGGLLIGGIFRCKK